MTPPDQNVTVETIVSDETLAADEPVHAPTVSGTGGEGGAPALTWDLPAAPVLTANTIPGGSAATESGLPAVDSDSQATRRPRPAARAEKAPAAEGEALRLGHYVILGELGKGGMGVVYAARDDKLGRKVAIKQLLAQGKPSLRRRLVREAQAMAKLSHPNVIPVYEIGEHEGTTFIVMEYVEGETLRQWLATTPRSQHEVLAVFKPAARGLIAAHAKDLVHRDFKPDNVMLGNDGRVRVMDFGLARSDTQALEPSEAEAELRSSSSSSSSSSSLVQPLTQVGAVLGTPAYMPPEQLRGQQADDAADQFSYCVALYEGLYGHRPFAAKTLEELRRVTATGELREVPKDAAVPAWLRKIVVRGLAPEPADRFESMQVMLDVLVAGELAADSEGRVPPEYVFVAHAGVDQQEVRRVCEALLDLGVRPWLDLWNLEPGARWRGPLERALADAPTVLVCHGAGGWDTSGHEYAAALQARIERDPSTVYRVGLPGAVGESPPVGERCEGVDLDEHSWDDGVVELARLVGVDSERRDWLANEAEALGLGQAELCPYRGLEAFHERDARWMFGRDEEVGQLLEQIRAGESRFLAVIGASGSGKSSLVMAGVCPALRNGVLGDGRDWEIAYLRPGARPCESLARALVELRPVLATPDESALKLVEPEEPEEPVEIEETRDVIVADHHTLPTIESDERSRSRNASASGEPRDVVETHETMLTDPSDRVDRGGTGLSLAATGSPGDPQDPPPSQTPDQDALRIERLRAALLDDSDELRALVHRMRERGGSNGGAKTQILLVVDQLEELFTEAGLGGGDESAEAMAFIHNLLEATESVEGLWVVSTLRADFVQRGLEVGPLARALQGGTYFALPPMGERQIRAAIRQPARRVGFEVEAELVEKLVTGAAEQAGRLPLLQHVLRELWQRRDEQRRVLSYSVYGETGGLEGAIAVAAEQALEGLRGQLGERALLVTRRAMTRLVHLGEGTSGDTRRRARIDELGADEDTRRVLEAFVSEARVLVASEEDGVEVFEIAHEALIREWTTLRAWLDADREALHMRQELAKDAGQRQGRSDREFLWGRGRVEEASRVLGASMVELNEVEQGFLDESERAVRVRARRIRGGVVGFMVVAVVVIFGVLRQSAQISAQSEKIEKDSADMAKQNEVLIDNEREQKDSLSRQRGLRAQMLIPKDQESEALLLGVQAVGVYGPDWEREPPAEARAGLEQVLANDASIVTESRVLDGHEDELRALAYSPDGARVASASADGVAKIWDVASGEVLATLTGHSNAIYGLAFSPRGDRLATVSKDESARIWDASSGESLALLDAHAAKVVALAYSPDGTRLMTGGYDAKARVWDAETGEPLLTLEGHGQVVSALAFSPDGSRLATASYDGTARIWDAQSGKQLALLTGHTDDIEVLVYSPDGTRLATASHDKSARIWAAGSGEQIALLDGHDDVVRALVYSPDGTQLATGSEDNTVRIWSTERGEPIAVLEGHQNSIWSLDYSPDGQQLASSGRESSARIWDMDTHAQIATLVGHTRGVFSVAYSPKGAHLASASLDGTVRIWASAIENPMVTHRGHEDYVYDLAFSPDGLQLATAGRDASARVWDRAGKQLLTLEGHEAEIMAIAYSPDGARLATASYDETARIWDSRSGELVHTLTDHEHRVRGLAYSPDGTRLATASYDETARIWDADSGEALVTLVGHEGRLIGLSYSPDGARLATFSWDGSARIWDAESGDALVTLVGHEHIIWAAAYSPDGTRLATASEDGSARIWDPKAKDPLAALLGGHDAGLSALAYSPGGDRLATASKDGTARVWAADDGEPLLTLAGHEGPVHAITYTPDGSQVVTGGEDGSIRIWDAANGEQLSILTEHESAISRLVLSPDGARLGSASEDLSAKIWDLDSGELLTDLRDRIGLRQADGAVAWPVPEIELTRMGCRRLQFFAEAFTQAADICRPLLATP